MAAKILIIEDHADTAQTTAQVCESWGYRTQTAENGADGLTAMDSFRPQLVLLDLELPKMSGLDVALLIRHSKLHRKVPIICITGHDKSKYAEMAAYAGCDQFLGKPVDLAELEAAIAKNLEPTVSKVPPKKEPARRIGRFW